MRKSAVITECQTQLSLSISETQVGVLEQHSDVERLKSIILTKQKDANFWKSMLKDKLMPSDGMIDISYNSIHHVYVCMHVCMYVCIIYNYIYIYIYTHVCMYVCMYVIIFMNVHVLCMYIYIYIYIYIYMYICMYLSTYLSIYP